MSRNDVWASPDYDKSYGPRGQWSALRKLFKGMELTSEDQEWLRNTTEAEVDGKMTDLLSTWKRLHYVPVLQTKPVSLQRAGDLIFALETEIEAIKAGVLTETKAREVAKFRSMQLTGLRLVLDAERLRAINRQDIIDGKASDE